MPTLSIHIDPTVLAHLASAGGADVVNISITLGDAAVQPAHAPVAARGPLAELMKAGLLKAGEKLAFRQKQAGRSGQATVTSDGQLVVSGHKQPMSSPSAAAEVVTGNQINGWTLWRLDNGKGPTLGKLREQLREMQNGRE